MSNTLLCRLYAEYPHSLGSHPNRQAQVWGAVCDAGLHRTAAMSGVGVRELQLREVCCGKVYTVLAKGTKQCMFTAVRLGSRQRRSDTAGRLLALMVTLTRAASAMRVCQSATLVAVAAAG